MTRATLMPTFVSARLLTLALLVAIGLGVAATPARAETLGRMPDERHRPIPTDDGIGFIPTVFPPPARYRATETGVITHWRWLADAPDTMALVVLRPPTTRSGEHVLVGSDERTVEVGLNELDAALRIEAGDWVSVLRFHGTVAYNDRSAPWQQYEFFCLDSLPAVPIHLTHGTYPCSPDPEEFGFPLLINGAAQLRMFLPLEVTIVPGDGVDFGDAPAPYPTLLDDDGARHAFSAALFLGECADAERDGRPAAAADGDDGAAGNPVVGTCASPGNDEDGVVFTSGLVAGAPATFAVTAAAAGLLDAWIDWNADGDWDDTGEQVYASEALAAGANALAITVPADAVAGTTFARFRLSTAGGLAPTGLAADGEVEDHAVTVEPPIQIAVDDASALEGDSGTTDLDFTVSVSSTAIEVSVTVATADGTATIADGDYAAAGPTVLTFSQGGPLTQTFTVEVIGDTTVELDETSTVELSSPSPGAVIADPSGLGTIQDDDAVKFQADVVGTKEAGGDLRRGGTVLYTVVLTNLGPGLQLDNPEDEFVDVLPPELLLLFATADAGTATADPGTNTVTWNGEIAAGDTVAITIEATIPEDTPLDTAIANQGTIHYDADGFTSNESTRLTDDQTTPDPEDPTVFLAGAASVLEIPTLDATALLILALLLAAAAGVALRR